ncbi:MAG: peptide deformylase [Candidatus Yonathbacteria bacterium]|nr:peptide deformylase [Candidatus Yonathbacteria bacterium]
MRVYFMVTILQQDAPVLREQAQSVHQKDFNSSSLKKILDDMRTTLEKEEDGVAIAAPQIGVPLRIFIISHRAFEIEEEERNEAIYVKKLRTRADLPKGDDQATVSLPQKTKDIIFINPQIIKLSRKKIWAPEGCLSVRWLYGETPRAEKATIRACDENGKLFTRGASGLIAQIFQHETDHLNGVLFIDTARNIEKITREEQEQLRHEHR